MAASTSIHDKLRELYIELLAENNSEANKVRVNFDFSQRSFVKNYKIYASIDNENLSKASYFFKFF